MVQSMPWIAGVLALTTGCRAIDDVAEELLQTPVGRCVLVLPESRAAEPEIVAHAGRLRASGLDVSTVTFRVGDPVEIRHLDVARGLGAFSPMGRSPAAALIVATDDELPFPRWKLGETGRTVDSDWPLLLGPEIVASGALPRGRWFDVFEDDVPWIIGRVPFAKPARIGAALAEASATRSRRGLLGAERHLVWFDSSWVLEDACDALEDEQWETVLYGEDWPRDEALSEETEPAFLNRWADDAPSLVVVNAHGSAMFDLSIGEHLIGPRLLDLYGHREGRTSVGPVSPAVLVAASCQAGAPWTETFQRLFDEGWVRAVIAPTESTEPTPLAAAIDVQVDFAALVGSGVPLGLAVRGAVRRYVAQAHGSVAHFVFDSTEVAMAVNALSVHVFGDPLARATTPGADR